MRKTKSTNPELLGLVDFLKKQSKEKNVKVWRDVAERLVKPRRQNTVVNLSGLNRYTQKGETVTVPGKVLATGEIDHPLTVAAFAFSERAMEKIVAAKGKCLTIYKLVEKDPKGSNVKILE